MRLKFLIPLGFALAAGCASNCQTCRAYVVPSGQADDAAPAPPRAPRFEPEEEELPPLPVPSPGDDEPEPVKPTPKVKGGRVRHVSEREVEGSAVVIDGNQGVITIGSSGVPFGQVQAPAVTQAPMIQAAAYPLIPGPVPDAVVFRLGQRVAGATYYLLTGKCPAPKAATAFVPVQTVAYMPIQVQQAQAVQYVQAAPALQYVQAPQQAQVQQAPAMAPAPQASPQQLAPRKNWFGR